MNRRRYRFIITERVVKEKEKVPADLRERRWAVVAARRLPECGGCCQQDVRFRESVFDIWKIAEGVPFLAKMPCSNLFLIPPQIMQASSLPR
jgi:hypothetical protein